MILSIWNYLRGYVIVEVTGVSIERFINMATFKGVYIWDISRSDKGIRIKVSIKAFRILKECSRKSNCKMKIVGKVGYPFVANRYRKRKILFSGILFFLFIIYFLSSFVWLIEINGNTRITDEQILNFCASEGLSIGCLKRNVDTKKIEQDLVENFNDISWVNIELKGTTVKINIAETIPKQEIIDKESPNDIVASKNGLVTSVITSSGTPLVEEGDVVSEGELLVTGVIPMTDKDGNELVGFVNAEAEVWAKMYYEYNFTVPYTYIEKQYTGKKRNKYRLVIFDKELNIPSLPIKYTNYDKYTERTQLKLSDNYVFPIVLIKEEYREFIPVEKTYTPEEAKEIGNKMLNKKIISEIDFEADIVDKKIYYNETDEGIEVSAVVTTIERIDQKKIIDTTEYEDKTIQEIEITDDENIVQ